MSNWEDVSNDIEQDSATGQPFGGVEQVDGLVYSEEVVSPELQWQTQQVNVPPPPVRPRPERPFPQRSAEPWLPSPEPEPAKAGSAGLPRPVKALLVTLIPLAALAGLGWIVYQIMLAYGL